MNFDMKAPIGIYITSYERSKNGKFNPILSHIFWGKDINQAFSYAKSHLISDVFFSSSFTGDLPWNDSIIIIDYDGEIISTNKKVNGDIDEILDRLSENASDIRNKQDKSGIIQTIQKLSKK
jgi:hypothetical protein